MTDCCEQNENAKPYEDIKDEIKRYGDHGSLHAVDRDGDLFYVECPSCHGTELAKRTLMACKKCFTVFQPYYEDGLLQFSLITQHGSLSAGSNIKIFKEDKGKHFWYPIYGRNEGRRDALKAAYPDIVIKTLAQDYRKGTDAHGHAKYKRFAIIPLDND